MTENHRKEVLPRHRSLRTVVVLDCLESTLPNLPALPNSPTSINLQISVSFSPTKTNSFAFSLERNSLSYSLEGLEEYCRLCWDLFPQIHKVSKCGIFDY